MIRAFMKVWILCFLCACTSTQVVTDKGGGILQLRVNDAEGRIRRLETYYLSKTGKKILHGPCQEWTKPGLFGVERVYEHGKLVKKLWISAHGRSEDGGR